MFNHSPLRFTFVRCGQHVTRTICRALHLSVEQERERTVNIIKVEKFKTGRLHHPPNLSKLVTTYVNLSEVVTSFGKLGGLNLWRAVLINVRAVSGGNFLHPGRRRRLPRHHGHLQDGNRGGCIFLSDFAYRRQPFPCKRREVQTAHRTAHTLHTQYFLACGSRLIPSLSVKRIVFP